VRVATLVLLAGCFDPEPPAGVPCSATAPCPTGQRCVGGTCDGTGTPDDSQVTPPDGADPDAPPGGDGDLCASAIPLALDAQGVTGSLDGAADDFDPPAGCGSDGIEMVYVFDIPQDDTAVQMSVRSSEVMGVFYLSATCPPASFQVCGSITNIGGASATSTFDTGKAYLVIERTQGTGNIFTIRP
jgi:hypothetical protein